MRRIGRVLTWMLAVALAAAVSGCAASPSVSPAAPPSAPITTHAPMNTPSGMLAHTPTPASTPATTPPPAPIPAETPEPEIPEDAEESYLDIPGMKEAGLTDEQMEKLVFLLFPGMMEMGCFESTDKLTDSLIFQFLFEELQGGLDYEYEEDEEYLIYKKDDVEELVRSAFGIPYKSKYKGDDELLEYKNGVYRVTSYIGTIKVANVLKIERISDSQLQFTIDVIEEYDTGSVYCGKYSLILEEDGESIFGFHMVSKTEIETPSFVKATASSSLPDSDGHSYGPGCSIDGDKKTYWAPENGNNQWLMLYFDGERTMSGMNIYIDKEAYTEEDDPNIPGMDIVVELLDGRTFDYSLYHNVFWGYPNLCYFGEEVKTEHVKIIIASPDPSDTSIVEAEPF